MGKKGKPVYNNIKIVDIGAEGKALAKVDGLVVFTDHVVPGDVIDLIVTRKRKKYHEGRAVKIHKFSKDRVEAFCEHFGVCGGCSWQILPYDKQLYYKQKQVADQLWRIGKAELPPVNKILPSPKQTFYRNKLEFTFSDKRWLMHDEIGSESEIEERRALGFHVTGFFDKVVKINKCWLQPEPSNRIRNYLFDYAIKNDIPFFNFRGHTGFLRTIFIRTTTTGEVMLIVVFNYDDETLRDKILEDIKNEFPEITSLVYIVNQKANSTINDQAVYVFSGEGHIWEEMEGLRFKIGPKSFYQTNPEQAYELYKVVRNFAGLTGEEVVYDLYTGTGTIANFLAGSAKKVVGIESVPEAIGDAVFNSEVNSITNTSFFAGEMKDILNEALFEENGKPDVVITDPPRAGMHTDVVEAILDAAPVKIVYVSCNPATQARDIGLLKEKYKILEVQPVDMFPHTHHVENVVLLELKN